VEVAIGAVPALHISRSPSNRRDRNPPRCQRAGKTTTLRMISGLHHASLVVSVSTASHLPLRRPKTVQLGISHVPRDADLCADDVLENLRSLLQQAHGQPPSRPGLRSLPVLKERKQQGGTFRRGQQMLA